MSDLELRATVSNELERAVVVTLDGRLDADAVDILTLLVTAAVDVGKPTVVLDLSQVTFVDFHGLDALVGAAGAGRDAGVALALRSPSTRVLDMLLLMGADGLFAIQLD